MKRKEDKRPLWKKTSPGTLVLRALDPNRRIKPKQLIHATPEQLGKHLEEFELIKGKVDLNKYKDIETPSEKPLPKEVYKVDHVGGGWYNVLSPDGKKMNEDKLRAEDADKLKKELEATEGDE